MIAVLITAHNRKHLTLRAIEAVLGQGEVKVFLVDDGSTDGTAQAVRAGFPEVVLIEGSGSLYWNRGMHLAWTQALSSKPDFFLWLNDDVHLRPGALSDLLRSQSEHGPRCIAVGRTVSDSGLTSYGGYVHAPGLSRLRWRRLFAHEIDCDTMNGNCVLLPASAVREIGLHDRTFTHALGDIDYGLRARRAGYRVVQLAEPAGMLERRKEEFASPELLRTRSWSYILFHPKGLPIREWLVFCARHGGLLWPVNFVWAYGKLLLGKFR